MFHVQLRQFPNLAHAFNLTREELDARILAPWASGGAVRWNDRQWSPQKARITIYEGPELRAEDIGLGRGWANVTRAGQNVTERLLAESARPPARDAALGALREAILARAGDGDLPLTEAVELATELHPDWRASDRLALAEQAIWELLHIGSIRLLAGEAQVERDRWQPVLLAWDTWSGRQRAEYRLRGGTS